MRKIGVLAVLLFSFFVIPAFAVDGILSAPFSSDGGDYKAMYGNYVVWQGNNGSIKLYDTGKTPPTTTEIGQGSRPNIFGNVVVWIDSTLGNNIVKYDISTGAPPVQISQGGANRPWIHGNKIVWVGQDSYIRVHDIYTGQTSTLPVQANGNSITIHENSLAYARIYDIYTYNLQTGMESYIDPAANSSITMIDADYVYWVGSGLVELYGIKRYKLSTGSIDTFDVCGSPNLPRLDNGKIYVDMSCDGWDIYQLDTKTGNISALKTPPGHQWAPAVYGNRVALSDSGYGIRFFDITRPNEEVYSLNTASNTVTVINPYDGHVVQQSLAVGQGPSDAGLSPDGTKLYVLNSSSKTVTIAQTYDFVVDNPDYQAIPINPTVNQIVMAVAGDDNANAYVTLKPKSSGNGIVRKIYVIAPGQYGYSDLPVNANPTSIKISSDGKTLYVSNSDSGNVTSIDVASYTVKSTITSGSGTKLFKP